MRRCARAGAALIIVVLTVSACADRKGTSETSTGGGEGVYDGKPLSTIPVVATFDLSKDFSVTTARSAVIKKWGEPKKVVTEKVTNSYDKNIKDTRTRLEYDGVSFLFYHSASKDQELLVATTITSPEYAVSNGMRVGMYKSVMLTKFGQPTFVERGSYVFSAGLSSSQNMNEELVVTGDTVSKIVIYPEIP